MRIAFDARSIQGSRRGMGSYARSLLKELARQGRARSITLFTDIFLPALGPDLAGNFRVRKTGGPGGSIAWEQVWFPLAAGGYSLAHCPANAAPLFSRCPVVVTLHDAIFMRKLGDISRFTYLAQILGHSYRKTAYPRSARRAMHILTVSEHSRGEISRKMGIDPGRITVTGEALPDSFREEPASTGGNVREKFGISGDFFLAFGAYEKRKNISVLFRALKTLDKSGGKRAALVLVGAENLRASGYDREIREQGLENNVILLPFIPDADLKGLYSSAAAFLFPSRDEGFGLPILEAMSCGTPVISADIPASRETAGNGAEFLPPDDDSAWGQAMARSLAGGGWRSLMSNRGRERSAGFSWGPVAEKTWKVYEEAVKKG